MFDLRKFVGHIRIEKPPVVLFLISVVWVLLNGASLLKYPTVSSDEALVSLVAFRQTGPGQLPTVSQYDPFGAYPFRLYLAGLAQWFNLFGVGLVQGRVFSLVAAYLAGWLMFLLGRQLYDARVGVLAGTLLLFSTRVFWTSHYIRPEMWVVVVNLLAFWAGWWLIGNPSPGRAVLVGFLSVAILDVYLSTLSTTLIVGLLIGIWSIRNRRWSILLAFGVGCLAGAAYYGVIQFLLDWPTSLQNWQRWLSLTNRTGEQAGAGWAERFLNFPSTLFENYVRYSVIGWLELVYFIGAAIWLVKRHKPQDLYVLGGSAIALVFFGVMFATSYHAMDGAPLLILIVAVGLVAAAEFLAKRFASRWPHWLTSTKPLILIASPLLGGYIALSAYYWWADRNYDYFAYVHELQQLSDPQAVILGEGTWWFGFTAQPYWWDEPFERNEPDVSDEMQSLILDTFSDKKITLVFVDENLGMMPEPSSNIVGRNILQEYIVVHCQLRGEVSGLAYGIDFGLGEKQTRVYSCSH